MAQVRVVAETLSVNLVNVFCARWPRGEPATSCADLDTTNRRVVAGRLADHAGDSLARQFDLNDLRERQFCQGLLLRLVCLGTVAFPAA